ncbi:hypothetical protein KOI35_12015 [Actinoplanes bogorensis]|uniref:Uncharacterized protein n=1 Tax=Paractinoplanes bogorensis TaxID=1610840 RepID=A0ABS5YNB0_9ACTN|nr:hypothetical protein [Actinoplanes bogorensis]MBU2664218.1 hypothetical protein [Actinoplanes bogorensis]
MNKLIAGGAAGAVLAGVLGVGSASQASQASAAGPVAQAGSAVEAGLASRPGTGFRGARVTGTGEVVLTFAPDRDVRRFSFDVRAKPYSRPLPGAEHGLPSDATGTVRVSHWVAAQNKTVTFEATADCLVTAPGAATVTAIVTRADKEVADWVGQRVGLSVQDGGRGHGDRIGVSWVISGDQDDSGKWGPARIGTCLAPTAFAPVTKGDLTVRHADLKPYE